MLFSESIYIKMKFAWDTGDQADRIHFCSRIGGHFLALHPRVLTRGGLCWQNLSDRITQPFRVRLRQDITRVFTPLPQVLEHYKMNRLCVKVTEVRWLEITRTPEDRWKALREHARVCVFKSWLYNWKSAIQPIYNWQCDNFRLDLYFLCI